MNTPIEPTPNKPRNGDSSKLLAWFGWTWLIAGAAIAIAFAGALMLSDAVRSGSMGNFSIGAFPPAVSLALLMSAFPPLVLLVLLLYAWFSGRRRMALGVLAAMGCMLAMVLLLVAACSGLVPLGWLH
jgi:hypothetical protein